MLLLSYKKVIKPETHIAYTGSFSGSYSIHNVDMIGYLLKIELFHTKQLHSLSMKEIKSIEK